MTHATPDLPSAPSRTALVTGATRGIGRAIATDLARDHRILVGGRDQAAVTAVAEQLAGEPLVADLADEADTANAVAGIDRLDVLVHNAGIWDPATALQASRADWRRIFEINVIAVADLTRLLAPALQAANGQVIMINSGAGLITGPNLPLYRSSKFAMRVLTDVLREELRGQVRVSAIHPGMVDTDMQATIQQARGNTDYRGDEFLTPESVATAVRTTVDASPEAMVEMLSIRPIRTD